MSLIDVKSFRYKQTLFTRTTHAVRLRVTVDTLPRSVL